MSVSQTDFRTAILSAETPVPTGLVDAQGRAAGRRFDVYRNNVAVSLTEALETGFPVIAKLLGDENFKAIAGVFLRQSPPSSPLMMQYGDEFPRFLANFEPLAHIGYLADIAQMELALRRSYHAADCAPLTSETLGAIAPDDLAEQKLGIAPSTQIIQSAWPIFDIWTFNMIDGAPKPRAIAQDVIITRPDFDPEPHILPTGGADFLRELRAGQTLGDAAETTIAQHPNFDLGACLGQLLEHQALTSLTK